MKKIILLLIILLSAGYGLLNFHFILLDNDFKIIQKTHVSMTDTFVDARGTKKLEILLKPDLIEAGINDVINQVDAAVKKK